MSRRAYASSDLAALMSEAELLAGVVEQAAWRRVRAYHTHDSRHSAGGFPDVIFLGPTRRGLAVELKRLGRWPRPAQQAWLDAFDGATFTSALWTPLEWHSGHIDRAIARLAEPDR